MYKTILLPTDGSMNAKKAGKHALKLINSGGKLVLMHVIEDHDIRPGVLPISNLPGADEGLFKEMEKEGEHILRDLMEYLRNECPDKCSQIKVIREVRIGKPYLEIIKAMGEEKAELVVMGASGRHGLDRVILGSVTERVVRESSLPILIIP